MNRITFFLDTVLILTGLFFANQVQALLFHFLQRKVKAQYHELREKNKNVRVLYLIVLGIGSIKGVPFFFILL